MPKKPPAKRRDPLEAYRGKRDFTRTAEPPPGPGDKPGRLFVIQEHHARSHHFDLRLEMNGTLASWAVPKGIPDDPAAKRLAVQVEDHPVDYATFEGTIPAGSYGAGEVAIWDKGRWSPLERDWKRAFARGKLKFRFHGEKLRGPYLLTRLKEDEPNWLLRKLDPEKYAGESAKTPEREPCGFVAPQLARPVAVVPAGKEWSHEIKFDGYRLVAVRKCGKVTLFTRGELDWTGRFRGIARRLEALDGGDFVIDGEAVVFDERGISVFGDLQAALKTGHDEAISYVAFDLLHEDGRSLRELPLSERMERLARRVPGETGPLRRSKSWPGPVGADLFQQTCVLGMEGIISKRLRGIYQPGSRREWTKSKCRPRQEFVVCGYTPPKGTCPGFGALLLGSYENGKLVPRGKVGTGFTDAGRRGLLRRMQALPPVKPPFPSSERGASWVAPELVAEIEFTEITRDGAIRQGSFISLREDKPAPEVHIVPAEATTTGDAGASVADVEISHPDRVVFPDDGITKLEIARYYERAGELILPHLKNRPLALLRAPGGIGGDTFFQKSFKNHVPDHVKRLTLDDGTEIVSITKLAGLISLVQFGVIEIHPWGARLPDIDKPDQLIWDLDPDKSVPWKETLGAALLLRDVLERHDLETRVKTSGGKGLHVILPVKRRHSWDVMKPFAKAVAARVAALNPDRFTITSSLKKRAGRIYIDWLRNGRGATCIAPWALRARAGGAVSMPIDWDDLPGLDPRGFTLREPSKHPPDWTSPTPQSVPVALIREFTGT